MNVFIFLYIFFYIYPQRILNGGSAECRQGEEEGRVITPHCVSDASRLGNQLYIRIL